MGSHDWDGRISQICAETARKVSVNLQKLTHQHLTGVTMKAPGDFVTDLDISSEATAKAVLNLYGFRDDQIVSEESSVATSSLPEWGWVIDPLDGTSAVIFGCGVQYPSVLVAYCENHEPVVAEVVFPFTGERFSAIRGRGAKYNGQLLMLGGDRVGIEKSWIVLNRFGDSSRETTFMSSVDRALRMKGGAGLVTAVVPNSGVGCRVAQGKIAAVVHDNSPAAPKQCVWDIAAPKLILEEAGGVCVDQFGKSYQIGSHQPLIAARSMNIARAICEAGLQ